MERREVSLPFPPCKALAVPRPVAKDSSGIHALSMRLVLASSMHPASAPLFLAQVAKPQLLCSLSNKASTTKEKSTLIYSRFTIGWPRPSVDQAVRLRRPVPAPFFLLRNRAADRGPIQMYGAGTFSVAEIAGHALTDLSVISLTGARKRLG